MDENRYKQIVAAIDQFIRAKTPTESQQVLEAHPELLSEEADGLLQLSIARAHQLGNEKMARILSGYYQLIAHCRELGIEDGCAIYTQQSQPSASMKDYFDFLQALLLAEWESNYNFQAVYPVLQHYQDKLDDKFAPILQQWARNTFSQVGSEQITDVCTTILYSCDHIQNFPLGNRASNLEIAITGYETVLEVYTYQAFPQGWASTLNNLGIAYLERIRGEKRDNLEKAINCYEAALQVRTRQNFPQYWAMIQDNLGNAYCSRIEGKKAENMEKAISFYEAALQVRTRQNFPQDWATTQTNLGTAYAERIRGEKKENLEKAICAYENALQVFNRQVSPQQWATTQNNLGRAYAKRIQGEKKENLEKAICACENALQVFNRQVSPQKWAVLQQNLGSGYQQRIQGERRKNLERAICAYENALQVFNSQTFPQDWANTQNNLGNAYQERIQGEKKENLEKAICACENALQVYTRQDFPQDWAETQNNLGNAYQERIQGDKEENLKRAVTCYEAALQVRTREAFPEDWAATQNSLGAAYGSLGRIQKKDRENLEKAIAACENALQVYTLQAFPQDWAETQINLGNAYLFRTLGKIGENLEQAINCYEATLQVYTRENFPQDWARTQNNLGAAYRSRIEGEKGENLDQAIAACENALQIYTPQKSPQDWARTQLNLGNAYKDRIRGEKGENLERAINCYEATLQVYTRQNFPQDWAHTQNSLGLAYQERIRGEKRENLEKAISAYENALQIFNYQAFPQYWATTQNNLGIAYRSRIEGEKSENLEQAITAYENALQVYTRQDFPQDWARTQHNLGNLYSYRDNILDHKEENLERAITAYKNALQVYTSQSLYVDCRNTARSLARLYVKENRWSEAIQPYQLALEAVEVLYEASLSLTGKEEELATTGDLFYRTAYALTHAGYLESAVVTLERGRARSLSETLARDRADLERVKNLAPEVYDSYQQAASLLRNLEAQERIRRTLEAKNEVSVTPEGIRQHALQARQKLNNAIQQIRQLPGYENFLASPTFEDISQALQPDEPLIYLTTTLYDSLVFIVHRSSTTDASVEYLRLDSLTFVELAVLLVNAKGASESVGWFGAYDNRRDNRQGWFDTIDRVTNELWSKLMEPVISHLKQRSVYQAILIPTGFLGLLPLHAAWTEDLEKPCGRRYALDEISLTYAPNARSLITAREIAKRIPPDALLAVDEPRPVKANELPNSEREVQTAVETFPNHRIFKHEQATQQAVKNSLSNYSVLHFSCHGYANLPDPLNSGLLMAHNEILSLRDLFDQRLDGVRLAVLSACETAISGGKLIDEVVSLPTGMLQAGAAGVAASLWSVSDISTMMLMARFYELWRNEGLKPPEALRLAQQWVRDTTNGEKAAYFENFLPAFSTTKMAKSTADALWNELILEEPDELKFAHPFHWAAFTYTGV